MCLLPSQKDSRKECFLSHTAVPEEQGKFILPWGPSGMSLVIPIGSQSKILPFHPVCFPGLEKFKTSQHRDTHIYVAKQHSHSETPPDSTGTTSTESEVCFHCIPVSFLLVWSLLGLTRGSAHLRTITKVMSLHQHKAFRVQCIRRSTPQAKSVSVTSGGEGSNEAVAKAPTRLFPGQN